MSLMKRMRDITVATLNDRLEQCDDPVQLIDRVLRAQKEQIICTEKLVQQTLHHAKAVRQQYLQAEQMKEKRERQAAAALKAGEEELARLALQDKIKQEEQSVQFKQLYEQSKHAVIELEDQFNQMKSEHQEVLAKRQYYVARMESVRLQQRMNEQYNQLVRYGSVAAFGRLEERIVDMEYETKALQELRGTSNPYLRSNDQAFQQTLDTELAALRKRIEQEGWSPS